MVKKLYLQLSLPPLPPMRAEAMCELLIRKLCLPPHFQVLATKFLDCVYKPNFDSAMMEKNQAFELECMAIIVFIMRMIYHLNDIDEL